MITDPPTHTHTPTHKQTHRQEPITIFAIHYDDKLSAQCTVRVTNDS